MSVYIIVVISVLFFGSLSQVRDKEYALSYDYSAKLVHSNKSKFWFLLLAVILVCIAGFRFEIGTDFNGYYLMYERFAGTFIDKLKTYDEPGFGFLCWTVIKLGGDGADVMFLASLITVFVSMLSLYKNTYENLIVFLLYIFLGTWHESFNAVRQCLAAAFIIAGFNCLKSRKFFKYLILIVIAGAFHRSALIMIFMYFIVNNKIRFRNILALVVVSIIILFSFDTVFSVSETFLEADYTYDYKYITTSVNVLRVLVAIVPAFYFLYIYRNNGFDNDQTFYMNLILIHATVMLATSNSTYFARVGIYTAPFAAVATPELLKILDRRNRRIITVIMMLLYLIFWFYEIYNSPALNPFRFIWQKG